MVSGVDRQREGGRGGWTEGEREGDREREDFWGENERVTYEGKEREWRREEKSINARF